jgi:hypothetical protein
MTKIEDYQRQASLCDEQAGQQRDPEMRRQFERLAEHWRDLATKIHLIEQRKHTT